MKFIIGLGNPEPEYSNTKHNVGFEVVKAIAKASGDSAANVEKKWNKKGDYF